MTGSFRMLLVLVLVAAAHALQYCDNNCVVNGYFCILDSPNQYTTCKGGVRISTTTCPTGLAFDDNTKSCMSPSLITGGQCSCALPSTTAPPAPATTTTTKPQTTTAQTTTTAKQATSTTTTKPQTTTVQTTTTTKQATSTTTTKQATSTTTTKQATSTTTTKQATSTTTTKPQTTTVQTTTTTKQVTSTTTTATKPPSSTTSQSPLPSTGLNRVCYYTNWAYYRPAPASYTAANVDPFMCTHIIVAFMTLSNATVSYGDPSDPSTFATLTGLRASKNPSLKIMAAIGGWNAGSPPFTAITGSNATMTSFISQAISFLRSNNLDGLDIDWEYPLDNVPQYTQWMTSMRAAFEAEAQSSGKSRLLLSAAVAAGQSVIDYAYNIPKLSAAVDLINLMSYDLMGPWSPGTGLNSGIYPQNSGDEFNVQWVTSYWVQQGADPKKLMVGIPTYGHVIKLCNPGPTQTGMGATTCGTGNVAYYTDSAGTEAYYESCLKLQCPAAGFVPVWNNLGEAPYMYSGSQWISYENATSIADKVKYVMSQNYGGVMVWALDFDDFNDMCGCGVKSPLMSTLVAVATNQPLPTFNAVNKPTVNACIGLNIPNSASSTGNPGTVTTTPSGGTNANLSVCDSNCAYNGPFCVPDNPNVFYKCKFGVRYPLQLCQPGLLFNYLNEECDWPANYPGCNCTMPSTASAKRVTLASARRVSPVPPKVHKHIP